MNNIEQLLDIDMECAALEDVLHGQEGERISKIRKMLKELSPASSQDAAWKIRELAVEIFHKYPNDKNSYQIAVQAGYDLAKAELSPASIRPKEIAQMLFDKRRNFEGYDNPVYYEGAKDAAEYILSSPASINVEQGWITVEDKDRLPEIGEFVLVYNTEKAILTGRLMNNGWVANFLDGEKFMAELYPTHWMPLPAPPNDNLEPQSSINVEEAKDDEWIKKLEKLPDLNVDEVAEHAANNEGYPKSDKTHFDTTYWTQHNIFVAGFKKGAEWQPKQETSPFLESYHAAVLSPASISVDEAAEKSFPKVKPVENINGNRNLKNLQVLYENQIRERERAAYKLGAEWQSQQPKKSLNI